jgi:hypothetical protein
MGVPRRVEIIASEAELARALERVACNGGAALPFLRRSHCAALAAAAAAMVYRPARKVIGEGERQVLQDFTLTDSFAPDSPYHEVAAAAGKALAGAVAIMARNPLPPGFTLNDLILQRYAPGSRGITPHRDHIRYRGVVLILVMSGDGRFCLCADRGGSESCEIPALPGDLLLMRAPGFRGEEIRPFHFLTAISRERLSFGLRWDSAKAPQTPIS